MGTSLRWKIAQAAEIRWWKHYLRNKRREPYLSWKKEYWRSFLRNNALQLQAGERILDAGCGPAGIFMVLEECEVHALDPLLTAYESSLAHFRRADYPNVTFHEMQLEAAGSLADFDRAFCLNALNHVENPVTALRQVHAALRQGGRLTLTVDVHRFGFLKDLFRLLPGDVLHPQQNGPEDYLEMIRKAGFTVSGYKKLKTGHLFDYVLFEGRKGQSGIG